MLVDPMAYKGFVLTDAANKDEINTASIEAFSSFLTKNARGT